MKTLNLMLATLTMAGCGTMNTEDFVGKEPSLDLFEYFAGSTMAWGLFEDRFGKVRRQFKADIQGNVKGDVLELEEDFRFADGEVDERTWRIRRTGDNTYSGTAADVVGEAVGATAGNAVNWRYTMDLKLGDGTMRVKFDDWMFLQADGVLINRARVSKLGLEIGTVTLFFTKPQTAMNVQP
jgi:hypothetical protein